MIFSSHLIEQAVNEFAKLPGIGKKTALRLVLHLLKQEEIHVLKLSNAISTMRNSIKYRVQCHNVADHSLCNICSSPTRKKNQLCVVESIRDVMAIEATQQYNGLYHILGGLIAPLDGIGPETLHIPSLLARIEKNEVEELIMALNPTLEGDTTTYYISKKIHNTSIKLTMLSRGVAFGGELEYADDITLARSFSNRVSLTQFIE